MTPDRAREIVVGDAMIVDGMVTKDYAIRCVLAACEEESRLTTNALNQLIPQHNALVQDRIDLKNHIAELETQVNRLESELLCGLRGGTV